MKKHAFVLLFLITATIFALPEIVEKWIYSNYYAKRVMIEIGLKTRFRYEEVYKWGADKMVLVHEPVRVNWVRLGQNCYMGSDTILRRSPMLILDLEDLAFKEILQGRNLILRKADEGYWRISNSSDQGWPSKRDRKKLHEHEEQAPLRRSRTSLCF